MSKLTKEELEEMSKIFSEVSGIVDGGFRGGSCSPRSMPLTAEEHNMQNLWNEVKKLNKMKQPVTVKFKKLHPDAQLPTRAKPGDAGMDMVAVDNGKVTEDGSQIVYSLGLAMELPPNHVGLLFPRSSVVKTTLSLANSVGVIDEGYRGEMKAVFNRRGFLAPHEYKAGDRICQLVVLPIPTVQTEWAEELSTSERGEGGWGSSGK